MKEKNQAKSLIEYRKKKLIRIVLWVFLIILVFMGLDPINAKMIKEQAENDFLKQYEILEIFMQKQEWENALKQAEIIKTSPIEKTFRIQELFVSIEKIIHSCQENLFLEHNEKINQTVEACMKGKKWEEALKKASQSKALEIDKTPGIQKSLSRMKKNILICQENLFLEYHKNSIASMKEKKWEEALLEMHKAKAIQTIEKTLQIQDILVKIEKNTGICQFLLHLQKVEFYKKSKEWHKALQEATQAKAIQVEKTPRLQQEFLNLEKNIEVCQFFLDCETVETLIKSKEWQKALSEINKAKSKAFFLERTQEIRESLARLDKNIEMCQCAELQKAIEDRLWYKARKLYRGLSQKGIGLEEYAKKIPKIQIQSYFPEGNILSPGIEYSFKVKSQEQIYKMSWEYGDGQSSLQQETTHIYQKEGNVTEVSIIFGNFC